MTIGTGASPGVGFAQVMVWRTPVARKAMPRLCKNPGRELQRFLRAHKRVTEKNNAARQKTARRFGDMEAAIFDAYHMMLQDEEGVMRPIHEYIRRKHFTAEYAISSQFNILAQQMLQLDSEYMRQRADDIFALRDQLLQELGGFKGNDAAHLTHPTVVVANNLSPQDLASIDLSRLEGIVCEAGGYSSHMAIISRTLGIPAIVGARGVLTRLQDGDIMALDGESGEVWINPTQAEIDLLRARGESLNQRRRLAQQYRGLPTITADGHRIELAANISRLAYADRAAQSDADCIGIFRTEAVHNDRLPMADEEAQYMVYRSLLEKMGGKAVTIRTYDDGGHQPTLSIKGTAPEENPVLGYRGIRMGLGRVSFLRSQLRALLRASAYGTLKILLPMVSTIEEVAEARAILDDVKLELLREQIPFDQGVPVGLLMEVPAAALTAKSLARQVDFFTIGLEGLIQFTMAIDRGNPALGYLHSLHHPAVLQLVASICDAAHSCGIPCYASGETQGYDKALPLLVGFGLDGFAMTPGRVLHVRRLLAGLEFSACYRLALEALTLPGAAQVETLLDQFSLDHPLPSPPQEASQKDHPLPLRAAE